jgi:hypothetical protein
MEGGMGEKQENGRGRRGDRAVILHIARQCLVREHLDFKVLEHCAAKKRRV